jgi:hypothetical protein
MNKAIVICYVGRSIEPDAVSEIQQIITSSCGAMPELMTIKAFDEDSIAKALLKKSAEDLKISFTGDATESRIIEEARTKAIQLIKSKYSGATGHISLTRDIIIARYHHHANIMDDDERTLLDAIEVIVDIPQKRLNTLLPKAIREVIFTTRDL